jgi:Ser/Thr protein kinase RdoA (MazF antagonist)
MSEVAAAYAAVVGPPRRCRLWLSGSGDVYLVDTERGRYVLRLYRAGDRSDGDVAYELAAVRHLAQRGVPVAAPVRRADGAWFRTLAAPEGPRQAVLFAYARGREAYDEAGYARLYGRSVATVHAAAADFRSAHPRFRLDLGVLLDRPLARLEPLLADRPADWRYLLDLAGRLRAGLTARGVGLDWGFCHGDVLGGNAHLEGDTVTGTLTHFDFDDCGPGWRAYDLATYRWITTWRTPEAAAARWEEYLEGYRERRPIGAADLGAVPLFVALREFWVVGQQIRNASLRGHYWVQDNYVDRRLRFLREWERQHPVEAFP